MKHIALFEGWEQTEMDFKMTPAKYEEEVDNAISTMSPIDAARHIRDILKSNDYLKSDKEALIHTRKIWNYIESLPSDVKDAISKEFAPEHYERSLKIRGEEESKKQNVSSILDRLIAGEISKEEAIASLV